MCQRLRAMILRFTGRQGRTRPSARERDWPRTAGRRARRLPTRFLFGATFRSLILVCCPGSDVWSALGSLQRSGMDADEKVVERRIRRALHRRGLALVRSRVRDPAALGFGGYQIVEEDRAGVARPGYTLSLADAEAWVERPVAARHEPDVDLVVGHCIDRLRSLPPNHFHTCVTSPPFWFIRDNQHRRQIGLNPRRTSTSPGWSWSREVRSARPDGTLWLNVGDSFVSRRAIRPTASAASRGISTAASAPSRRGARSVGQRPGAAQRASPQVRPQGQGLAATALHGRAGAARGWLVPQGQHRLGQEPRRAGPGGGSAVSPTRPCSCSRAPAPTTTTASPCWNRALTASGAGEGMSGSSRRPTETAITLARCP